MTKLAVIRIRGNIGLSQDKRDTLILLKLYNKNYCAIVDSNSSYIGMLTKVKDYVTWGELDQCTFCNLLKERGRFAANKKFTEDSLKKQTIDEFGKEFFENKKSLKDIPGLKQFFRLRPPVHGFERGGVKKPFSLGGVLGYRKDRINNLLMRMI